MNENEKIDHNKFLEAKKRSKKYYDGLNNIQCPYLKKQVHFNEEGFGHLLSKSWNKGRSIIDQYTRLRILPKAVEIIKSSHTLQEHDERILMVRQKINSRWEKRSKMVRYYVFIHLLRNSDLRLKVIVKEIEGGQPFFWSIYPTWKVNKKREKNNKIFYAGNLEED